MNRKRIQEIERLLDRADALMRSGKREYAEAIAMAGLEDPDAFTSLIHLAPDPRSNLMVRDDLREIVRLVHAHPDATTEQVAGLLAQAPYMKRVEEVRDEAAKNGKPLSAWEAQTLAAAKYPDEHRQYLEAVGVIR